MRRPLRVLVVESSPDDAELVVRALRAGGYDPTWERVETAEAMRSALATRPWDVVVADYSLPHFDAFGALKVLHDSGLDLPLVVVSSIIGRLVGEEIAVAAMRAGAQDYILKDNLTRLAPVVERELREAEARAERRRAEEALRRTIEDLERRIVESGRVEEALRESEEPFRAAVDSIPQLVWTARPDGFIFWYNRRCYEYTGATFRQLEGWGWLSVVDPTMRSQVLERWKTSLATGEPFDMEFPLRGADGRFRWFLTRVIPLRDAQGRVTRWFGTNTDIDETREAEEALRESEERFRAIVLASSDVVYRMSPDWSEMRQLVGRAFLVNTEAPRPRWLNEYILPEDQAHVRAVINEAIRTRSVFELEHRVRRADGSIGWTLSRAVPLIDSNGEIVEWVGTASDITERKRAEAQRVELVWEQAARAEAEKTTARLEAEAAERRRVEQTLRHEEQFTSAILDTVGALVVVLDREGRIVRFNRACEEVTGYSSDEVIGQRVWDRLLPPEEVEPGRRVFADLRAGRFPSRYENYWLRRDGTRRLIAWSNSALLDGRGEVEHVIGTGLDITERRQAENERERLLAEVRRHAAQLDALNKEMESFSYSVSHDLRTPLRAIDGFSQVLLEDYADRLDDQGKHALQRVRAGAQRMGLLIDDLLTLSRVTRWEMHHETIDLSAMARLIVTELQRAQPERQVEFVIAPGLRVTGDPRLLRLALENLLSNAWKFTSKRPKARIGLGATQHEGKTAYFVRDNGAGFDMAYADKLFKAFQRLHGEADFPGTGVGLATVQRIIHRHGGEVWAEGEVDKGATFYFTLGHA